MGRDDEAVGVELWRSRCKFGKIEGFISSCMGLWMKMDRVVMERVVG